MLGVLTDLADRSGLAKLPPGTAWRRFRHLPRGTWGYAIAHFGVGVLIAGIVVSTAWRSERIETVHAGDTSGDRRPHPALCRGDRRRTSRIITPSAPQIVVERPGGAPIDPLPRAPLVSGRPQPDHQHRDRDQRLWRSLSGARRPGRQGGWVLRAYYNPLVPWIWFGAILAALGGVVSLTDRRLRVRSAGQQRHRPRPCRRDRPIPDDPAPACLRRLC